MTGLPNNSMQRAALRAAADAKRSAVEGSGAPSCLNDKAQRWMGA